MKNEFSRRTFLKASGVTAAAVMMGSLSGCWYGEKPAEVQPFNKELTAGKCKVTFLTVGGTRTFNIVQEVTLKVENLSSDEIVLKKEDFTVMMNDKKKLEIGSCKKIGEDVATGADGRIPVAAGNETEISLWLAADSQPDADTVETITASVTINGTTVSAIEAKKNFKWWYG